MQPPRRRSNNKTSLMVVGACLGAVALVFLAFHSRSTIAKPHPEVKPAAALHPHHSMGNSQQKEANPDVMAFVTDSIGAHKVRPSIRVMQHVDLPKAIPGWLISDLMHALSVLLGA